MKNSLGLVWVLLAVLFFASSFYSYSNSCSEIEALLVPEFGWVLNFGKIEKITERSNYLTIKFKGMKTWIRCYHQKDQRNAIMDAYRRCRDE